MPWSLNRCQLPRPFLKMSKLARRWKFHHSSKYNQVNMYYNMVSIGENRIIFKSKKRIPCCKFPNVYCLWYWASNKHENYVHSSFPLSFYIYSSNLMELLVAIHPCTIYKTSERDTSHLCNVVMSGTTRIWCPLSVQACRGKWQRSYNFFRILLLKHLKLSRNIFYYQVWWRL